MSTIFDNVNEKNPGFSTRYLEITPGMAAQLLSNNEGLQRDVSQAKVIAYAQDMREGHWVASGDALRFGKNGQLFDGQHRLHACVLADTSFDSLVITDCDAESVMPHLDRGKTRSYTDWLRMHKIENPGMIANLVAMQYRVDRKEFTTKGDGERRIPGFAELDDTLRRHPGLHLVATIWSSRPKMKRFLPSECAGLAYQILQRNYADGLLFLNDFEDPDDVDSIVGKLRKQFISSNQDKTRRLPKVAIMAKFVMAWNAAFSPEKKHSMKFTATGKDADCFPEVMPSLFNQDQGFQNALAKFSDLKEATA